uniref:Negative elongation factor B n=1 Tax=Acrobeloides nanus TaxID=290746 RepID=A0A914EBH3_9BILA
MSTAPSYTKELENYGIPGPSALRDLLTSSNNLPETIKEFQAANSIQLPSLKPVMKLLDLHNIRRTEYHELVVHELTDKILLKLRALGEKRTPDSVRKLERQLEKCFKLYKVPKIRPIVLETLKQLPKVADRYLKLIICDKEFYDSCAVTVRQQIWVKNDGLFLEAINPVIASYITEKDKIFLSIEKLQTNFFTCDTTKSRRQWPQVQELISMVGEREVLYERLMEIIRERYFEAGNTHYCSLRLELLMAAHDVNVEHVVKVDPCHDFAWCLDACVRDKHLDSQQTNKLKILLDTGKKSSTKVLADMAMIASDPHVVHFLCSMSIKVLRDNASSGAYLPREQNALQLLIKLIALGASGKNIITEQIPQQLVDPIIFTKFLPSFTMSMIEDIFRYELNKAPGLTITGNEFEFV